MSDNMKRLLLVSVGVVWLGAVILYFAFGKGALRVNVGKSSPAVVTAAFALAAGFLLIGWVVPICAGVFSGAGGQALSPEEPLPLVQRRINRIVPVLLGVAGTSLGLWEAYKCAQIAFGYVAAYSFAAAFLIAFLVGGFGLPLVIYWRTRWIGVGLFAAGVLSLLSFYGGIAALTKLNRVAWRHEPPLVHFHSDQKASAVIYFCEKTTNAEIENFVESVLEEPAEPRHAGRDFPPFVAMYWRPPKQAIGYKNAALAFRESATPDQIKEYLTKIKADTRVRTVFTDVVPSSIHLDNKSDGNDNCR